MSSENARKFLNEEISAGEYLEAEGSEFSEQESLTIREGQKVLMHVGGGGSQASAKIVKGRRNSKKLKVHESAEMGGLSISIQDPLDEDMSKITLVEGQEASWETADGFRTGNGEIKSVDGNVAAFSGGGDLPSGEVILKE